MFASRLILLQIALGSVLSAFSAVAVASSADPDSANPSAPLPEVPALMRSLGLAYPTQSQMDDRSTPFLTYHLGNQVLYVTRDLKHLVVGRVVDLASEQNLTEKALAEVRLGLFNADFLPKYSIRLRPDREGKTPVYIFTDFLCPYCNRYHKELTALTDENDKYDFIYIPFVRGRSVDGLALSGWSYVFCDGENTIQERLNRILSAISSKDAAFQSELSKTDLKSSCSLELKDAPDGYRSLGASLGLSGTPMTFMSNGGVASGALSKSFLLKALNDADQGLFPFTLNR